MHDVKSPNPTTDRNKLVNEGRTNNFEKIKETKEEIIMEPIAIVRGGQVSGRGFSGKRQMG